MRHRVTRGAALSKYAEVALECGLDARRMLREFQLPLAALRDPELKIPIDAVRGLLEASAERGRREAFGLLMAERRKPSDMGPLGLLIREQPTLRRAIETVAHYANRVNESLFLTVEDTGDVVVLREELIVGSAGPVRQSTELAIGVAFRALQAALGSAWKPRRVCFAHDAPQDRSVHQRVFGRIVEFGHVFNGIVCARADMDTPNPNADAMMAHFAQRLVDTAAPGHAQTTAAQVRHLVVSLIGSGSVTIDAVARHLGTTRRTIHRQLARDGQSYTAIVEAVRRELASRYVNEKRRPLSEVSSLLGFSGPSAFARWYRAAFSQTASEKRRKK